MASKRSSGNGRAVRIVEGPVIPPAGALAPVPAEVVADDVAKAFSRVDFVMRVFWRLPWPRPRPRRGVVVLVDAAACLLSSAWARESSFSRRRWWARLLRADRDEDENLEKKIVSSRCGICEARYAEVKTRIGKYGRDGRGEGADTAARAGFVIEPATRVGSSGTI